MKKQLILVSALFFSILCFSQGIEFEHGTWKEVLEKAKQTSKPIFIDVYTSWCGPCKKMSKEIFPLSEVGKVYNANFVCYQIDAEKGEGIAIAKKYEVKAYPTYLFIKADGTLFSRSLGSMDALNFISVSKTALAEMNDPNPIATWEKKYAEKKNDHAFLLEYMNKRSNLGKSNTLLFDEYLKLIPEERRTSDTIIALYKQEEHNLNVNSLAYKNLQKNKEEFFKKLYEIVNTYLYDGIINSVSEAAKSKDEQLLQAAILAFDQTPKNPMRKLKDELYMDYYKGTGESKQYFKYTTDLCNNQLMNLSIDSIDKKDQDRLEQIEKGVKSGAFAGIDSTQLALMKEFTAHMQRNLITDKLNNAAWEFFQSVTESPKLQDALRWSQRSNEMYPNNPMLLDTYANLLYKLGKKEEAITKEKEAILYSKKEDTQGFENTILKMKSGEITWKQEKI